MPGPQHAKVVSATIVGLEGIAVEVEADVAAGLPQFHLVGLPDMAVREARDRVRAAIKNCGVAFPQTRVTVNLAPADLRKEGPAFDLPVAAAIMLAHGRIEFEHEDGTVRDRQAVRAFDPRTLVIGELGLDGSVRPVAGALSIAIAAKRLGLTTIICPAGNADEASVIDGVTVLPVRHLRELIPHLLGQERLASVVRSAHASPAPPDELSQSDLAYVAGLHHAKRVLEVAAAGGHNLLLVGPPGTGKSMLAKAIPTILPEMVRDEQIEVTLAHSVVGLAPRRGGLIDERPFRSPHHSASDVAIIGGGSVPKPGEVTLAHHGVLFMDEFPEFGRSVLEALRQPLEEGHVTVSRASGTVTFPACFQLVAAQNPCPCGYFGDRARSCVCSPGQILRYQQRISGPLLDRIDLVVDVPRQPTDVLLDAPREEQSAQVRTRVNAARERQRERATAHGLPPLNARLTAAQLRGVAPLDPDVRQVLLRATDRFHLSARATIRTLRVARTIADLDGANDITLKHLGEALSYRPKLEAVA